MSVVERAIRNLKQAGRSGDGAEERRKAAGPVGAVVGGQGRRISDGVGDSVWQQPARKVEFDFDALRQAGLYPRGNERIADEYRIIKRPILKKAAERDTVDGARSNLVMVASALAGEGKTFTSFNLSMSLASEKDWQVLLVDVDCKSPQLSRLLGVRKEPGLLDMLQDPSITLDSVVLSTSIERLNVLPLGTQRDDAAELLASARMSELCEQFGEIRNQFVVFDSSPLLLTTESVVLSSHVGQVVLVVNAYEVPQQAVEDAVAKLDENLAIGFVLNRVSPEEGVLRYGGYVYGYGNYPGVRE